MHLRWAALPSFSPSHNRFIINCYNLYLAFKAFLSPREPTSHFCTCPEVWPVLCPFSNGSFIPDLSPISLCFFPVTFRPRRVFSPLFYFSLNVCGSNDLEGFPSFSDSISPCLKRSSPLLRFPFLVFFGARTAPGPSDPLRRGYAFPRRARLGSFSPPVSSDPSPRVSSPYFLLNSFLQPRAQTVLDVTFSSCLLGIYHTEGTIFLAPLPTRPWNDPDFPCAVLPSYVTDLISALQAD